MTLQFTNHAIERYIQFHMLDVARPDLRDVRELLEKHADQAIKLKERTHSGQTQWRIEALGCELVSKHDEGIDVVVTILPPLRFRGLTPAEAERLETEEARWLAEKARLEAEQQRILEEDRVAVAQEAATPVPPGSTKAMLKLAREAGRQEREARLDRLAELKVLKATALHEREILSEVLRTMRHQMDRDENTSRLKRALRAALRALRDASEGVTSHADVADFGAAVLGRVKEVAPDLATDALIDGGG
jgi:hypothetical protein